MAMVSTSIPLGVDLTKARPVRQSIGVCVEERDVNEPKCCRAEELQAFSSFALRTSGFFSAALPIIMLGNRRNGATRLRRSYFPGVLVCGFQNGTPVGRVRPGKRLFVFEQGISGMNIREQNPGRKRMISYAE